MYKIKIKFGFSFPNIIQANLQEKEVKPTTEIQEVVADEIYDGLSKVIVDKVTNEIDSNIQSNNIKKGISILGIEGDLEGLNGEVKEVTPTKKEQTILPSEGKNALTSVIVKPIPDDYIIPSGTLEITENGIHDVKDKEFVNANIGGIDEYLAHEPLTSNFTDNVLWMRTVLKLNSPINYDGTSLQYAFRYFNGEECPELNIPNITNAYGMFMNAEHLKHGINFDTSNVTNMGSMYYGCYGLLDIPIYNTQNVTNFDSTFFSCSSIVALPQLNTSKATSFRSLCYYCDALQTIPQLDASNVVDLRQMLYGCNKLVNFGGLLNIGQSYSTTASANYNYYRIDLSSCTELTHDSIMNVINKLYDIASAGVRPQQLILGNENLAKLLDEEKAIAQNKGWTLS